MKVGLDDMLVRTRVMDHHCEAEKRVRIRASSRTKVRMKARQELVRGPSQRHNYLARMRSRGKASATTRAREVSVQGEEQGYSECQYEGMGFVRTRVRAKARSKSKVRSKPKSTEKQCWWATGARRSAAGWAGIVAGWAGFACGAEARLAGWGLVCGAEVRRVGQGLARGAEAPRADPVLVCGAEPRRRCGGAGRWT